MYTAKFHPGNIREQSFLITGGAGFIGSNIVEYLMSHGAGLVRVMDNFSTGSIENIRPYMDHPSFQLIEADIRDFGSCRSAAHGIKYIFHEAALGSVPRSIDDPLTSNDVNICGFLNMLTAARDEKARMVYAASSSTYGDSADLPKVEDRIGNPLSPYAVTKYVNELYAGVFSRVYNFHATGLRYFNVFGPRQNPNGPYAAVIPLFINAALANEAPVINGDGKTSRDFTYVENVVQANIKAMFKGDMNKHEVFNVACGENVSLNELWQHISLIIGTQISPAHKPERKGDVRHSLADISKARRLLGYSPSVNVREGLEKAVEWYMSNIPQAATA